MNDLPPLLVNIGHDSLPLLMNMDSLPLLLDNMDDSLPLLVNIDQKLLTSFASEHGSQMTHFVRLRRWSCCQ